jgi:hypothetical protein
VLEAWLGQRAFPRALRIEAPAAHGLPERLAELQRALAAPRGAPQAVPQAASEAASQAMPAPASTGDPRPASGLDDAFVVKLATLAWRLGVLARKVDGSPTGRSIANRTDALAALLRQQGVQIIDASGDAYDPGETWDEVMGESLADDAQPYIAAMQAPRVRRHGRLLQRGIPIVKDRRAAPGADGEERNEGSQP